MGLEPQKRVGVLTPSKSIKKSQRYRKTWVVVVVAVAVVAAVFKSKKAFGPET